MMRVTIAGSGNVAEIFAEAIVATAGLELAEVCARNRERGGRLAAAAGCRHVCTPEEVSPADVYLIAVKDSALAEVAGRLAAPADAVVLHMAGGVGLEQLHCSTPHCGVLYPLQTFSSGHAADLSSVPMLVEGATERARQRALALAGLLSRTVLEADSRQRAAIHTAGVFACNFTNHMLCIASRLLKVQEVPFSILEPLVAETLRKAFAAADPALVQTGPAVRNDTETMARHLALLSAITDANTTATSPKHYHEIYKMLSKSIWETSKKI